MAWCVGNAKIEPRGNALLITKQASGFAKIDPLMALLNAAELMARTPEPAPRSFYDDPEFMRVAFGGVPRHSDEDEEEQRGGWRRCW
jgi:phage terminase large subunit-like protein